jgi:hypothetical protein
VRWNADAPPLIGRAMGTQSAMLRAKPDEVKMRMVPKELDACLRGHDNTKVWQRP